MKAEEALAISCEALLKKDHISIMAFADALEEVGMGDQAVLVRETKVPAFTNLRYCVKTEDYLYVVDLKIDKTVKAAVKAAAKKRGKTKINLYGVTLVEKISTREWLRVAAILKGGQDPKQTPYGDGE